MRRSQEVLTNLLIVIVSAQSVFIIEQEIFEVINMYEQIGGQENS